MVGAIIPTTQTSVDRSSSTATTSITHEEVTTLVLTVLAVASEDHLLGGETVAGVVPGTFTALPVAILAMVTIEALRISIRTVEDILLRWTTTLPVAIIRLPAFVIAADVHEEIEIDVNSQK